jgi:hypothetical protein
MTSKLVISDEALILDAVKEVSCGCHLPQCRDEAIWRKVIQEEVAKAQLEELLWLEQRGLHSYCGLDKFISERISSLKRPPFKI